MSAQKARILHPNGSFGITSFKQAKRYVRRGRAVFVSDDVIRFVDEHHQNAAAGRSDEIATLLAKQSAERAEKRVKDIGYDTNVRTDGCTRNELRHLPFVGRIDVLIGRGKQRRKGAAQAA